MPENSLRKTVAQILPNRYTQISESHCGPAVVQMLLANLGLIVSQEEITEAGGAKTSIDLQGTHIRELARAVRSLAPHARFWFKDKSSINDISTLINEFHFPVAVEWQGVFEENGLDSETGEEDYGHYSIVTVVDENNLVIVDPYKDFANQDRIFTFEEFIPRWWDTNEVADERTGRKVIKKDERLLFIITPRSQVFPDELGLQEFS